MIYLCSPYAHPDPHEMEYRFHSVCEATALLLKQGKHVFSPIAHNHYLACNFDFARGWDFWQHYDLHMLERADEVLVLMLDGWQCSVGIQAELVFAIGHGKPINYIDLEVLRGAVVQHSGT